jgi:hypothetical protein
MLKNSKFNGCFPLKIFQGKMEIFFTRKNLKISLFSWKIVRGKHLEIYYFVALNFQIWKNLFW